MSRCHRLSCLFIVVVSAAMVPLSAAEPRSGDEAIEKYLAGETKLLSLSVLAEADSREAWEA